jgi:uncharacterized protein with NRDE domain
MCVLAFAWRAHPDWPLVLAGNRDERHDRPSLPLARWDDAPEVLGGRDLEGGGTWLGVSEQGRLAVVTNLRGFGPPRPEAPSRGRLARDLLIGAGPYADISAADLDAFNPMNLIVVSGGQARFCSNRPPSGVRMLASGIYGLSNGDLDEPWPKTRRLKTALADWLHGADQAAEPLLEVLADETRPADAELPSTGLDLERERLVSPIFIRAERYGTRCSTVVCIDREGRGEIVERRFGPGGEPAGATALKFSWPAAW